tara:strand:- start:1802 stop:2437 length:636 start_codon:yes stop_codon:yes gene_type:complete
MKRIILSFLPILIFCACGTEKPDSKDPILNKNSLKTNEIIEKDLIIFKVKKDSLNSLIWKGSALGKSHFGTVDFEGSLGLSKGKLLSGLLIFDMRTINTQDLNGRSKEKLDNHLKDEDFFNVKEFPSAQLSIKSFDGKNLIGDLTIKEITREITFPASLDVKSNSIIGKANFSIDRTDYGILYGSSNFFDLAKDRIISDKINFNVSIKAIQ